MTTLAWLFSQGRIEEANCDNLRAIGILEKARGPHHPDLAVVLDSRATLLREQVGATLSFSSVILRLRLAGDASKFLDVVLVAVTMGLYTRVTTGRPTPSSAVRS